MSPLPTSYEQAGVNRKGADRWVETLARSCRMTHHRAVKASIGGYASLYEINREQWIAASTDGVGTKLKLAFEFKIHQTIGIDLVAMSVNDLLCVGASPLFFLDYFATGKLSPKVANQVMKGIIEGCRMAGCALVGGETAEMPGFYSDGEYDLAGFAVGRVHPSEVLPKKTVAPGDVLIGIASSGCHSNGYSLVRKLLGLERGQKKKKLGLELLTPTWIYVPAILPLLKTNWIKGMAHITGSGFLNVPRISEKVSYQISLPPLEERPGIYHWIQSASRLPLSELAQTFNLGIGMVLAVAPHHAVRVLRRLNQGSALAWKLGQAVPHRRGKGCEVFVRENGEEAVLKY